MTWTIADLSWLPDPPDDFAERCRSLEQQGGNISEALRRLADHRLDGNKLTRLAKTIGRLKGSPFPTRFRLGLLSNATTELVVPAIVATAARYGVSLDVVAAPFDQVAQQSLDPKSVINASDLDAVLLAIDYHGLPILEGLDAALEHLSMIQGGLDANGAAPLILQTIPRPPTLLYGSLDARRAESEKAVIDGLNRFIVGDLAEGTDMILDIAGLAETVGLADWHNPAQWHMAKLPFSQGLVPLYADHVVRLIAALRGKTKKCLVLDLDNTLWGGVVGDDGIEGLSLGQGDPVGEAFLSVQEMAIRLRERGIILAVCSKNDEVTALKPFREHDAMVLKEDHFSVFQANWADKASNLEAIADALQIGIESLVLLDDNPAERAQVRDALPMVGVPELPDDPALFPMALLSAGYFETVSFSEEDCQRSEQYRDNARRAELRSQTRDLSSYLRSLDMNLSFAPFDAVGRGRIAQLINKTNQFNLTAKRYTEAEVEAMEADPDIFTLQVRLADRFGDNGMISVVICLDDGDAWTIDTWLMSCRVIGRRVEEAVFSELLRSAKDHKKSALKGTFIESGRNEIVRDHFFKIGFGPVQGCETESEWLFDVAGDSADEMSFEKLPFKIV